MKISYKVDFEKTRTQINEDVSTRETVAEHQRILQVVSDARREKSKVINQKAQERVDRAGMSNGKLGPNSGTKNGTQGSKICMLKS